MQPCSSDGTPAARVIDVAAFCKRYGKLEAVRGITFDVKRGEIFGLIGPDGAGKTTTFHSLAGVMEPTSGTIRVLDRPVREARPNIGYLTQLFSLHLDLSVDENVRYAAGLRRVRRDVAEEREDRYLRLMGLDRFRNRLARALSGGMKQKLALSCALISAPEVLLLDEPTTGVDPISRRELWDVLAELAGAGVTIVVATPYLDEAERCHRIALMHGGRIERIGAPAEVRQGATLEEVFVAEERDHGQGQADAAFPRTFASGRTARSGAAIEARSLTKRFGAFEAVRPFDASIGYGEIYGLLGANGAGKTTIIKMLCGLLQPSSGEIRIAGTLQNLRDPAMRRRIGYMSQKFTLYDDLTILENLDFYCGVYGIPPELRREKIDWVLASTGLQGNEGLLTSRLPGGWKQRVAFGACVLHEPEILFLDEPTSGVDPLARREFWRSIRDSASDGAAVLVTTHYLDEAEHCTRVGFMAAGRLVTEGTPDEIKAAQRGTLVELIVSEPEPASELLKAQLGRWRVSLFGTRLHVTLDDAAAELPRVRALLSERAISVASADVIPYTLEDAFINVVSRVEAA